MSSFAAKRRAHLELGRRGEELAAASLRQQGYRILARNWRTKTGELDIVAFKNTRLLFAEVKTLHKKEGFSPYGNLSPRQRRRNFSAAKVYMARMDDPGITASFDLFLIEYAPGGRLVSFSRIRDYLPPCTPPEKGTQKIVEETALPASFLKRLWYKLNLLPCPVCGTGSGSGQGDICPECRSSLEPFPADLERCPGCGGQLDGVLALCSQCAGSRNIPLWQGILSLFPHRGAGRRVILEFKYHDRTEYSRFLGKMGAAAVERSSFQPDIVTAVPMQKWRRFLRTYNQAELFGRMTAKYLHIPYVPLLTRKKHAARQEKLNRSGRLKNLQGAFVCISPEKAEGRTILLVDDVFTTGATMTAAVKALLKARPKAVYLLTASRTPKYFQNNGRRK